MTIKRITTTKKKQFCCKIGVCNWGCIPGKDLRNLQGSLQEIHNNAKHVFTLEV